MTSEDVLRFGWAHLGVGLEGRSRRRVQLQPAFSRLSEAAEAKQDDRLLETVHLSSFTCLVSSVLASMKRVDPRSHVPLYTYFGFRDVTLASIWGGP